MSGRITLLLFAAAAYCHAAPTFTKDVAPIFYKHCVQCHRPKNIAPMSLLDYKSARPWAKSIREAVASRKMPPWFADPSHGRFSNDPRLTPAEIQAITTWVDAGAPEGNPKDMLAAPAFQEGWRLGKPDIVIDIGEDHEVTPGEDAYEHFVVPSNLTAGAWVRAAEILPGNREVVHHVHVLLVQDDLKAMEVASTKNMPALSKYLLREGKLSRIRMDAPVVNDGCAADAPDLPFLTGFQEGALASFLPGRPPDVFPEGTAKWVPPGSRIEFVIHYARISGKPQKDRTSVGLFLTPRPPRQVLRRMDLRNFFLRIPAGEANHEVRRCYTFEQDKLLLSFTPHMHYRGKDMTYEVIRPNGKREILLSVPRYDFNWQLVYRFKHPVLIEKGSRMIVTAHYDNSPNNRANPDPNQVIRWGDKSEEEMMTSWIEYLEAARTFSGTT
ncbi:MAG: thiol-disulfide isomerase, partial [Acidobacteria bacterium]|nr:thiol-disulfide isomerase [Acidobacteriota bacterium]